MIIKKRTAKMDAAPVWGGEIVEFIGGIIWTKNHNNY